MLEHSLRRAAAPLLFVHISKAAGTSFTEALSSNFEPEEIAPFLGGALPNFHHERLQYKLYAGHYSVYQAESHFNECTWITFLRHPISRAVSQYLSWHNPINLTPYWAARIHPEELDAIRLAQRLSFEEFIKSDNPHILGSIRNFQTRVLCSIAPHERSPNAHCVERILQSAIRNLRNRFAFFGLVERFSESLHLFDLQFGPQVSVAHRVRHLNASGTKPTISVAVQCRLEELNQLDLALYREATLEFNRRLTAARLNALIADDVAFKAVLERAEQIRPRAESSLLNVGKKNA
jgi:hypothetical protein